MKNIILILLSVFTFCINANEDPSKMSDYVGYLATTHKEIAKYLVVELKNKANLDREEVHNRIHELDKEQKKLGLNESFTDMIEDIDQLLMNLGVEKVSNSKHPEVFNIVWQVKRANFFSRVSRALARKTD